MSIPNKIGPFTLDKSQTTMQYGYCFKALLDVPFAIEKRAVRIWLPEDYDFANPTKKYPVIYFADGQNLVNQNLCAFGCWKLDQVAHDSKLSFIAVGIDSPRDSRIRFLELNPPYKPEKIKEKVVPYGDKFINYIADILIPLINEYFYTKQEKEWTAIAGSSMGGIMAFFAGVTRNDTFGFSLDFSPAFFLYKEKSWDVLLKSFNISPLDQVRYYLYVGGQGFEKEFVEPTNKTYQYMKSLGFNEKQIALAIDEKEDHNEEAWHKHLKEALLFWLMH